LGVLLYAAAIMKQIGSLRQVEFDQLI
jgi:hypothetical protein